MRLDLKVHVLLGQKLDVGGRLQLDVLVRGRQPLVVLDEDLLIIA
jgi:hypothetical protein